VIGKKEAKQSKFFVIEKKDTIELHNLVVPFLKKRLKGGD
jgi:hypothetical protein